LQPNISEALLTGSTRGGYTFEYLKFDVRKKRRWIPGRIGWGALQVSNKGRIRDKNA
jgi:hypothetical protein